MPGSGKCGTGCTCNRHLKRTYDPCRTGCTCYRHNQPDCRPGCTCGRHTAKQKCEPGCTCGRHKPSSRKYTPEERAAAEERNKAKAREYAAMRRRTDPAHVKRERLRNKKHAHRYYMKSKYGITPERWHELLVDQSGCCYLCGDPMNPVDVAVDHDHSCCPSDRRSCGRCVRGLACRWCNQGTGQFRDDPARMRRAADALEEANRRLATAGSVTVI